MRRIDSAAVRCPRAAPHARACTRHLRAARTRSAVQRVLPLLRGASSPRCVIHRSPPRRSPPRRSRRLLTAAPPASALITAPLARRQLAHRQPTRRTPPYRSRTASLAAPLAHLCLSRRAAPSGPTLHRAACAPLADPRAARLRAARASRHSPRHSPPSAQPFAPRHLPRRTIRPWLRRQRYPLLRAIGPTSRSAPPASPSDPPLAPSSGAFGRVRPRPLPRQQLRRQLHAIGSAPPLRAIGSAPRSAPSASPTDPPLAPSSAPPPAPPSALLSAPSPALPSAPRHRLRPSALGSAVGPALCSVLAAPLNLAARPTPAWATLPCATSSIDDAAPRCSALAVGCAALGCCREAALNPATVRCHRGVAAASCRQRSRRPGHATTHTTT